MKEFKFIELLKPFSVPAPDGVGDDAAVVGDQLVAMDIMIEGTHFLFEDPVEETINHLIVSNISDIAAMGGKAGGYKALVGVAITPSFDKLTLSQAIGKQLKAHDMLLIGGDTAASTRGGGFICLTIIGQKGANVLDRAGAQKGDVIYVSKPLGAAKYYLNRKLGLLGGHPDIEFSHAAEPALGELLGQLEGITSCIDISDGLGQDLAHIARDSNARVVLDEALIPVADIHLSAKDKMGYAISSGEEYALAFTVSADKADAVEKAVSDKLGRKIYRIGEIVEGDRCWLKRKDGKLVDISHTGYEHE